VTASKPNFGDIQMKNNKKAKRKWKILTTTHKHNPFLKTKTHKKIM